MNQRRGPREYYSTKTYSTKRVRYSHLYRLTEKYLEKMRKRFWAKVDKRGPQECWPWLGAQEQRGYGNFSVRGYNVMAHRVSFELSTGPIGEGQIVAHLCDNPNCVNPKHLISATHKFNSHDCNAKGRFVKSVTPSWQKDK